MTPFYAVLEARRQTQRGTSVGSVLLSAAPAVSDADHSFSAAFARDHGVSLRFFPAGAGPRDSSVFEICKPQTPASPCENADLFSVLTIPPTQGDAKLAAVARTDRLARVMLGLMLALLLIAAPGAWRWGVVMVGAWTLLRAPVGPIALFSPATFYRPVPIIGASAGALHRRMTDRMRCSTCPQAWSATRRSRCSSTRRRCCMNTWSYELIQTRHRTARNGCQFGVVVVVASRTRGDGDGLDSACRGTGARCRRAAARVVGDSGGVCLGRTGGDRRLVVVGSAWSVARVVHVLVAARPGRCDFAGAAALGARRHGDRRGHSRRAPRLGRGGRRPAVARQSRCDATGTGRRCRRRCAARASGSAGQRAFDSATHYRGRSLRALGVVAARGRRLPRDAGALARPGPRRRAARRAAARATGPAGGIACDVGTIRRGWPLHRTVRSCPGGSLRPRGAAAQWHCPHGRRRATDAMAGARARCAISAWRHGSLGTIHDFSVAG